MQSYVNWQAVGQNIALAPPQPVIKLSEVPSPGMALWRHLMSPRPANQVEQNTSMTLGLSAGMIALLIALGLAINYQYGKAMAPNKAVESKWAWTTAIGGTIFPPFTLGTAIYRNYLHGR